MADKYYDMGAIQAFYDKIKTIFQTVANKVTSWSSTTSDDKYPSEKLVKDSLDAKVDFQYNDSDIGTNSPAANCKTFFSDDTKNPQRRIKLLYNDKGNENTIIFSKANSKKYGNILKYGYNDRYMYLLRYKNNEWQSDDWEKVYAGYADTAGKATTADSVLYADEKYGGAFRNSLSPFDNYAFKNSNCFFGAKASALSVEYSTDGGTTWVDYGLTDEQKQSLFSQYGTQWVACGKNTHIQPGYTGSISGTKDLSNDNIANQRLRITICTTSLANEGTTTITDNWIYCRLRRIGIYMSTNSGGPGAHCLIQRRTSANFKSATDTWVDVGDYKIQGDSGWNSIPCNNATSDNSITFGTNDTQTRQIRFIIWSDQLSSSPAPSQTGNLMIYKIVGYSEQIWTNNSANANIGNNGSPFTVNSSSGSTYFSKGLTSGVAIPVGSGGTGKASVTSGNYIVGNGTSALTEKTPKQVGNNVLPALDAGTDNVLDTDYIIASNHTSGVTDATTFVRRTADKLWNYIKGQISSVLGLSESNGVKTFTGDSATALAAKSGSALENAINGKQDDLGISSSGDTTKYLNEKGQWATPAGTAQVQSDWSQTTTTAVDYIKNKPDHFAFVEGQVAAAAVRNTMTVRKSASNAAVLSSGDGTTAANVYIRPKGSASDENQFVVLTDGSISLKNNSGRIGTFKKASDKKGVVFSFPRTNSNSQSSIRLSWCYNYGVFEVLLIPSHSSSGFGSYVRMIITHAYSTSSVHLPTPYTRVNGSNDELVLVWDNTNVYRCAWEYSGDNADDFTVSSLDSVPSSGITPVEVNFYPSTGSIPAGTAIGSVSRPAYVDENGRIQACDFDEAYKSITQLGQTGTGYDTTTTDINSTHILQATQNSYVINIKRLKVGQVYKFMFLEGSNSGQVYLCNGNGSNFSYASGPNGGTTKKLSLNGGSHGSSYTSYVIRDSDTSVYHIWGY